MAGRRGRKPAGNAYANGDEPADSRGVSVTESDGCGGEGRKISAQEEADLSSALIAKLLAEDCGGGSGGGGGGYYGSYYDDYGNGAGAFGGGYDDAVSGSEADDDWDPSRKRQRAPRPGRGRKAAAAAASGSGSGSGAAHSSGSGSDESGDEARKRPKKTRKTPSSAKKERPPPSPVAPGQYRAGAYTDDEETKFYEGLELYGRSWGEISKHVGTRDPKSIRSHAQKYFIKLFRDGQPLPDKVRESGEGYTLSGRPLDPNSAAARPYLQHVMQLDPPAAKPPRASGGVAEKQAAVDMKDAAGAESKAGGESVEAGAAIEGAPIPGSDGNNNGDGNDNGNGAAGAASDVALAGDADSQPEPRPQPEPQPPAAKSPARTEYAMSRPQRSHARAVAIRYDDPHQMVRCTPFHGQPLSGVAGCQPFRLLVHTNAQLQMDFHAHLMLSEVIGLLGGLWDAGNRVLTVTRAFPCDALESEDAHTNVEMDPGSELVVRQQIAGAGLRVVGWYHSHPTFRPDPSIIDIENQTAYQKLFRDNSSSEEPFVGAIVGPYDTELPGPLSALNWFCVGRSAVDRGHPKRLMVETVADASLLQAEQDTLLQLLDGARAMRNSAALEEAWRPSSTELRSLKMAVSLALRMPWLTASLAGEADSGTAVGPGASDCTASDGGEAPVEKRIPPAFLAAGRCAAHDPFLAALSTRFSAGVFKPGADGQVADMPGLGNVYAAYFMQWAKP